MGLLDRSGQGRAPSGRIRTETLPTILPKIFCGAILFWRGNGPRRWEASSLPSDELVCAYRAGGFILKLAASDDCGEGMRASENLLK